MIATRRPAAVVALAFGLAAVTAGATGCTLTSPKTITTPYDASDGNNAELQTPSGTVKFLNFLLVSAGQGKPGVLVGSVTTEGSQPVQVQISVVNGQESLGRTTVTAQPGQLTSLGSAGGSRLEVTSMPTPPGSVLSVRAQTDAGGTTFSLPVLAPQNQYATITPGSPSASPSGSVSASPSGPASGAATGSPSATGAASGAPSRSATPSSS